MEEIALMYDGKIMRLAMSQRGISWESPFGPYEFEATAREKFDTDIALVAIGMAKGYWKEWLKTSRRKMQSAVETLGYETFIRDFHKLYFKMNDPCDMVNALTMIMYILETSVQLYCMHLKDEAVVGAVVLADVLVGKAENQEEMNDRLNRLHHSALEMMSDQKYSITSSFMLGTFGRLMRDSQGFTN